MKCPSLLLISFCLILLNADLYSQNRKEINGTVTDKETGTTLPYASISLKNTHVGTISNKAGVFSFLIPGEGINDTLEISFIGYEQFIIPVKSIRSSLNAKLTPANLIMEEVTIYPLSPVEFLKKAVDKIAENYPTFPFQTMAYYREELKENGNYLQGNEAVFKSYYPSLEDTLENQHQIVLYRQPDSLYQFEFMREWIEKRGGEINSNENKSEGFNMGGPEVLLFFDLKENIPDYLDSSKFKDYKYEFGNRTVYQGREVMTINIKSRGKNEHLKLNGTVLLDVESNALVSLETNERFVIPALAQPVLLAVGLRTQKPQFNQTIKYEYFNDKWFPKDLHWKFDIFLHKRHTFKKNEHADIEIEQVFFVNEITTRDIGEIAKEKRFNYKKNMSDQVYNEDNLNWNEINVLEN